MGRRRRGKDIHGWLVIDKTAGMSSSAVVGKAQRILDAKKVGHGGTLDPLATGVLPLAFGEATKTMRWAMDGEKTYRFSVRWGEARDTLDAEGQVTETSDIVPIDSEIDDILQQFTGMISQVPPAYSAIHVDGQRAYDLARAGEEVDLPARDVKIHELRRISETEGEETVFEVRCGKGTYVRSLARDLADALGTLGYVSNLRRTRVGPFSETRAISLEKLNDLSHSAAAAERFTDLLLPVTTALDDIPALAVTEWEAQQVRNGQAIPHPAAKDGMHCVMLGELPVAIAEAEHGLVRPLRVFNLG